MRSSQHKLAQKMVHEVVEIQKISSVLAETDEAMNAIDSWATSLEEDIKLVFGIQTDGEFNLLFAQGRMRFENDLDASS